MLDYVIVFGCVLLTIVVHEVGHYISAVLCKVDVKVFSIGFGPTIWKKKIKNTEFRGALLPLGGYIKLAGEETKEPNGFLAQPYSKKIFILLSGIISNCGLLAMCYLINYGNLVTGIQLDLQFLYYALTNQSAEMIQLYLLTEPHWILVQLSMLNLFVVLFNLLPIPCLDGGQCVYLWLEKFLSPSAFTRVYKQLNSFGFWFLIWLQVFLVYWYWIQL
jgi:membrane-associated protease RseP (regulator of RpoE activity)